VGSIFDRYGLWRDEERYVEMGTNMGDCTFFLVSENCIKGLHGIDLALHSDGYSF